MNELTLKDAIQELEGLSTGNWVPYEYSPEEAKLILNHINNLQSKIDKAIEFINSQKKTISKNQADLFNEDRDNKSKLKVGTFMWNVDELLDILEGDK